MLAADVTNAQVNGPSPKGDAVVDAGSPAPLDQYRGDSNWDPASAVWDLNPASSATSVAPTLTENAAAQTSASAAADNDWHLIIAPYLWFPGVHGTIGALDRDVGIHASAGDLLSHFRFGLMGVVEPRYKRLVLPLDVMWVRLGSNNALPLNIPTVITANVKASEFILTEKVGFRIVDEEKVKVDVLTGFRYWHFGQNLKFTPSTLGLNFSRSQNWVDPLLGGRMLAELAPKVTVTLAGDVGGWGVGSQLDYQLVALLGYQIKPGWSLQAGYRYLYVDYANRGANVDLASAGVMFGVVVQLK